MQPDYNVRRHAMAQQALLIICYCLVCVCVPDVICCPAVAVCQNMEDWDQETLEKVVNEKHGAEKPSNATNIICKFFLDAVEKRQYGWFWKCPNGADCKYR